MSRALPFVLLLLVACKGQGLSSQKGTLQLTPPASDFGWVYPGQSRELTLKLRNDAAPVHVTWTLPPAPFFVQGESLPTEIDSGEVELTVRYTPDAIGRHSAVLSVEAEGLGASQHLLLAEARPTPDCPLPTPCNSIAFDLGKGKCVEVPLADGVSCADSTVCLIHPICTAGRCLGAEKQCDDGNACTTDTCNAVGGCEHLPAPPCPGDGLCQVGTCDPQTGCGLTRADDGTPCGPTQTCVAADVCIGGSCVVRDPPDGHVCAEASPCAPESRCVADVCQPTGPATDALPSSWSFDATTADAGAGLRPSPVHELFLEPNGEVTLAGAFSSTPQLRKNTAPVAPAIGLASRCLLWGNRYICSKPADSVSALDPATGHTLWTFNLRIADPGFTANTVFAGRMAVQSSDRLAVLWEAYPDKAECRTYFLSILDASGGRVFGAKVTDPTLTACNHPHAYGFAADSLGDLFVAFAPTVKNPPLVSGAGTTLMSFTRDGVFRWRRVDVGLKGGELAVARGLVYPEYSGTAIATATGQPAFTLPEPFGRPLVTGSRLLVAPTIGGSAFSGYEAGHAALRWTHALKAGQSFATHETRLAQWQTSRGPQTVALTFIRSQGRPALHAVLTADGTEAFTCPLAAVRRTDPQLFEVADGLIAIQDGADGCAKCEPSFADKPAAFHTVKVPGLSRALTEPWVGTYGGPGHDHREE